MANICGVHLVCQALCLVLPSVPSHKFSQSSGETGLPTLNLSSFPLLIWSRCCAGSAALLRVPWVFPGFGASLCVYNRIVNCLSASSISFPTTPQHTMVGCLPPFPWNYSPQGHLDLDLLNTMDVSPGLPFCLLLWCHDNLPETHPFLVCIHVLLTLLLGSL